MRAFRRLSITARITIGSLVIAFAFGAIAVVGVRLGVAAVQLNATITLLRHDTAPFTETLENHPDQAIGTPGESQSIAIVDPQGVVKVSTMPRSLRDRIPEMAAAMGRPGMITTANADYLTYTSTVTTPAGKWSIVAARNEDANQLVLDRLSVGLVVGAVLLALGFGAASWVLAHTALRPVNSMRRQADHLVRAPSDELLPVSEAHDELSALATTLNNLIGQLRASADREKQMVSDASHELRTPLAVLQGELEVAELDSGDPDALLASIRSSHAAVLRLSQLASNLLELSRIEAGTTGRSSWRDLTAELADAIDRARALKDSAEISIDFEFSPADAREADLALSAHDFGRILDNLLGNAVAALADAEPKPSAASITASLVRMADSVRLTITDNGPGMPVEFIPVALDRFTRADASRGARSGGGLGLAIVSALVTSAGGDVALANTAPSDTDGPGFRVEIRLPVVAGVSSAREESV
jgi:signal transduction histidine kinase